VLGGIFLFRRRPLGFVLGTAMAIMGAVYQLNLMMVGVFQAHAHVVGVQAFAPESVVLTAAFVVAAALLLTSRKGNERLVPERSGSERRKRCSPSGT
jgi:hypothetical protein